MSDDCQHEFGSDGRCKKCFHHRPGGMSRFGMFCWGLVLGVVIFLIGVTLLGGTAHGEESNFKLTSNGTIRFTPVYNGTVDYVVYDAPTPSSKLLSLRLGGTEIASVDLVEATGLQRAYGSTVHDDSWWGASTLGLPFQHWHAGYFDHLYVGDEAVLTRAELSYHRSFDFIFTLLAAALGLFLGHWVAWRFRMRWAEKYAADQEAKLRTSGDGPFRGSSERKP
jgi:hypothetical protein